MQGLLDSVEGKVIKGGGADCFLVKNFTRHSIPDWDTYAALHKTEDILHLGGSVDNIPIGSPLSKV